MKTSEEEKKLKEEISKFITDKQSIMRRIPVSTIKGLKRYIRKNKKYNISDLLDPASFQTVMETRINTIYNNITKESRDIKIKPNTSLITLRDAYNMSLRFMNRDLKTLLTDKYFIEAKEYKKYEKQDEDKIIFHNLMKIIQMKEQIVQVYLIFVLSFYKKIPSILNDIRNKEAN